MKQDDEELSVKYLALLEKYQRQSDRTLELEEQYASVKALAEECAEENARLTQALRDKEEVEEQLQKQLMVVTKELATQQRERNRYLDEKTLQEKVIQRLNAKLTVASFFIP